MGHHSFAPLRRAPRACSAVLASGPDSLEDKTFKSGNIINEDMTQSSAPASQQPPTMVGSSRKMTDSIPSGLNIGIAVPRIQHPVEIKQSIPISPGKAITMTQMPLFPKFTPASTEMNLTNNPVERQIISQTETGSDFASFGVSNGEQWSSTSTEDWQTLLSRAGVPGIIKDNGAGINHYPMFESDANQMMESGEILFSGDMGTGDFGWLEDFTVDWSAVLDPELAKASHLATMAEISAGGSVAMECFGDGVEDAEFTSFDAVDRAPEMLNEFNRPDMDPMQSGLPDEIPDEQDLVCETAFGSTSPTPDFGNSDIFMGYDENNCFSPMMVAGTSGQLEPFGLDDWNIGDRTEISPFDAFPALPAFQESSPISPLDGSYSPSVLDVNRIEDQIHGTQLLSHTLLLEHSTPSALPPFATISRSTSNWSVPGPEQMNLDDHQTERPGSPTGYEPDEMNIDRNISDFVIPIPTDTLISYQSSAETTPPPLSSISHPALPFEPETKISDINASGSLTVRRADHSLMDITAMALGFDQLTIHHPPSPQDTDRDMDIPSCPSITWSPGASVTSENEPGQERVNVLPNFDPRNNEEPALCDTADGIMTLSGSYIPASREGSIGFDNRIEELAVDDPEIPTSDGPNVPTASSSSTAVDLEIHGYITATSEQIITSDGNDASVAFIIPTTAVSKTHGNITLSSPMIVTSPNLSMGSETKIEEMANDDDPKAVTYESHDEAASSWVPTTVILGPSDPITIPSSLEIPLPAIQSVAHHDQSGLSAAQIGVKATQPESSELNHKAVVPRSIGKATQRKYRRSRSEVDRREWKAREHGIQIRKLTNQVSDLLLERVEVGRAHSKKEELDGSMIAGMRKELTELKHERVRFMDEVQSTREIEIGAVAEEVKVMRMREENLIDESERKNGEHAAEVEGMRARMMEMKRAIEKNEVEYAKELEAMRTREIEFKMQRERQDEKYAKELEAMRTRELEFKMQRERQDMVLATKRAERGNAFRADERKTTPPRTAEDEKTMSDILKTIDSNRTDWDRWPKTKLAREGVASTSSTPVPIKNAVTSAITPAIPPLAKAVAVYNGTKTPGLTPARPTVPTNSTVPNGTAIYTVTTHYSIALGSILVALMGMDGLATQFSVMNIAMLFGLIWHFLRWDSRSSVTGYIAEVTLDIKRLAMGVLFAFIATVITAFSWLKAIVNAPKRQAYIDTGVAQHLGRRGQEVLEGGGSGEDEIPPVDVVSVDVLDGSNTSKVSGPIGGDLDGNIEADSGVYRSSKWPRRKV